MSKLLINEPPLQVIPSLAAAIGLNEALFLQQLHYWLLKSVNERGGHRWRFATYDEWKKDFPFWSVKTIQRIVKNLEDRKLIVTTNVYNHLQIDNTKWYRIDYEAVEALELEPSGQVDQTEDEDDEHLPLDLCLGDDQNGCATGQVDQTTRTSCPDHLDKMTRPSGQVDQANNQRLHTETTEQRLHTETTTTTTGDGDHPSGEDENSATEAEVFTFFEAEKFGTLTPYTRDDVGDLIDTYGTDQVLEAMQIAVKANVRRLRYVRGTLKRMQLGWEAERFISGKYADGIEY